MMNAISGGHYAAQNIDAKLLGGQGTAQPIQQLITGQAHFIRASGIDVMRAVATTKVPLVSIATIYQGSTFHMVSLSDKPVSKAEDLKGKTVGIVSVGGTTDVFLDLILAKGGLKKEDVKREVTGNSPGALQIMKQGRVDCFIASIQVVVALQRMKENVEIWSTDRYAPMPGQCYVTTKQIIDSKGDLLARAMKAMRASAEEIMSKPLKPIFERAAKDFEIPGIRNVDDLVEVEKVTADKLWLSEGRENLLRNVPKLWKNGVDALRENKIAALDSPEALYTNQFLG
jgi:ABC-type nitrate/sulfonate/bicarbonate transport system substrate-binding protein